MGKAGQIVTTVVFGALATAGAQAETYEGALSAARAGPRSTVARARHLASSARVAIAVANGRPSLSLSANAMRNFDSDVYGPRLRDQTVVQLVVPLYAAGRIKAGIAAARAEDRAVREMAAADDLRLAVEVADAYDAVREARALRRIATDEVDRFTLLTRRVDAERRAGALASTDVLQARLHLASARRAAVSAEREEGVAAVRFEELVGRPPEGKLAPIPVDVAEPLDLESDVHAGNPELRSLRYTVDAAREQVAASRALGRPTLTFVATASYGNTGAALADGLASDLTGSSQVLASPRRFDHRGAATGLLVFRLPLSSGGEVASRTALARADLRAAEARASEREAAVLALAREALARARAAVRQQPLIEHAVADGRESLKGVEIARSLGMRSEHEVLSAAEELGATQRRQARLERERSYQAVVALAAAGRLPQSTLSSSARVQDDPRMASADHFDLARLPGSRITAVPSGGKPSRPLAYDFSGLA